MNGNKNRNQKVTSKKILTTTHQSSYNAQAPRRRRSPTLLKLQWLAERVRKCESLKTEIASGNYRIDSRDLARAVLNMNHSKKLN